jgi:hypothetical protein
MKTFRHASLPPLVVLCAVMIVALAAGGFASQQSGQGGSEAQASMRGIFITLTTAYNYSLDPAAFEDPANHMMIQGMLQALVANASELEQHGAGLNPSFGYMQRSLARDARDALDRFNQGEFMGSRFVISKITENCVTCHTKLPSDQDFDLGAEFVAKSKITKMKPEERVSIELATRQFDAALKSYEQILDNPEMTPENLALLGAFEGYLRVCIGAKNDKDRPVRTLTAYSQRQDVPAEQKALVRGWIAELNAADLTLTGEDALSAARDLIQRAEGERKSRSDRSRMVDYVVATTLLHRYVETGPTDSADLAETFYLMGVAESRITRSYWISETDFLLAQAIRTAPKSPVAKQAYDLLVEYTASARQGKPAREVPPELRANLEELRALIEE